MTSRNMNQFWTIAAAIAIPVYANAADRSHRCAEQFDDAQRLACYDAEYGKPVKGGVANSAARTVVAPAPAEARPIVTDSNAKAPKSAAAAQPSNFTASIKTLVLLRDGRFKATFDSGEVWTQLEPDKAVVLAVGDKVTVKRAVLGSFQLVTPAGVSTRVKRME